MSARRGVADMVRETLYHPDLDPDVRDLARHRLEARLTAAARGVAGCEALTVTLTDEGELSLRGDAPAGARGRLTARLDLELITQLAPTVGASRLAVKHGERAPRRASTPPPASASPPPDVITAPAPPSWELVAAALLRVVTRQQRRLDALSPEGPDGEAARELREIAAMLGGAKGE